MCNALGIITYNDSSVYVEGMQKYRPIAGFSFLGRSPFKSYRQHVNVKDQPDICSRLFFTPATLLISLMHSSL